jgi:hypothetical protein
MPKEFEGRPEIFRDHGPLERVLRPKKTLVSKTFVAYAVAMPLPGEIQQSIATEA